MPFDKYVSFISDRYYSNRGHHNIAKNHKSNLSKEDLDQINKAYEIDPFVESVCGLIADNDLHIQALSNINKYGEVNREGDATIVIVDYGATDQYIDSIKKFRNFY